MILNRSGAILTRLQMSFLATPAASSRQASRAFLPKGGKGLPSVPTATRSEDEVATAYTRILAGTGCRFRHRNAIVQAQSRTFQAWRVHGGKARIDLGLMHLRHGKMGNLESLDDASHVSLLGWHPLCTHRLRDSTVWRIMAPCTHRLRPASNIVASCSAGPITHARSGPSSLQRKPRKSNTIGHPPNWMPCPAPSSLQPRANTFEPSLPFRG